MSKHHRHHGHGHHHHHHHHHGHDTQSSVRNLSIAFVLNFGFTIVEFVGGLYTGSMAILSDALHDLGDSLALGMAIVLEKVARRNATPSFSYGFRRLSLVSAGLTGLLLVSGAAYIISQAIPRLSNPPPLKVGGMLLLAVFGILVNGIAALRVSKGRTLNEKTVSWHLLEDVLGWVVILVSSVVMSIWDLPIIDPILSIAFAVFILFGVTRNLKQVFQLFMQAVPNTVSIRSMCAKIESIAEVRGLHDVHIWSLDGDNHVMTMHAVVDQGLNISDISSIKAKIRDVISEFGKFHLTLEIEQIDEHCPDMNCGSGLKTSDAHR